MSEKIFVVFLWYLIGLLSVIIFGKKVNGVVTIGDLFIALVAALLGPVWLMFLVIFTDAGGDMRRVLARFFNRKVF